MKPFWGATVIDAWEGMEGNGPASGTPISHKVAVASTDYLAADRVMLETMGMKAENIGHLVYCSRAGLGQFDLAKIDIRGERLVGDAQALPPACGYRFDARVDHAHRGLRRPRRSTIHGRLAHFFESISGTQRFDFILSAAGMRGKPICAHPDNPTTSCLPSHQICLGSC